MQYNVTINEKAKTITVELDGYKGVAKCCETDSFNITTGIELALERAKVAKKNAESAKTTPTATSMTLTELCRRVEKALPDDGVVLIGKGSHLTDSMKQRVLSMLGGCGCNHADEIEEAYDKGYIEGYNDGVADTECDCGEGISIDTLNNIMSDIRDAIECNVDID